MNKYQLDGIDIDDEYSSCTPNNYSMIMLTQAIKTNPNFKGKLLTKALYDDADYFAASYQGHTLAEYLDYGWEMSYYGTDFSSRLAFYLQNGMTTNNLMIGGWMILSVPSPLSIGQYTAQNNLPGAMVYNITTTTQTYLSQLFNGETGGQGGVNVTPQCLQ